MILKAGLPLGELNQYPKIDIVFDGADEVDEELNCIKGGGGCHFQEKLIAKASKYRVIVADGKKLSSKLGTYVRISTAVVLSFLFCPQLTP